MNVLDWIVLTLAAAGWVDCWFNGEIFAGRRAYWQARADDPSVDRDLCAELMTCPYCFSHHTPWILALLFFVPGLFLAEPWSILCKLPVYCLAATRAGNIMNALVPRSAQYGRYEEEPAIEPDAGAEEGDPAEPTAAGTTPDAPGTSPPAV